MIMISFFPGSQERYLGLNGEMTALGKVTKDRGWDDDAHTLLGYAYRKREDYEASLESDRKALELNPHHRGALWNTSVKPISNSVTSNAP